MPVPGTVRTMHGDIGASKQHVYEVSTTKNHRLGTRMSIGDGRVFHYACNGAVLLADGVLLQGAAPLNNHLNCAVAATVNIGAVKVQVTLGNTALDANYYAEGYMHCNDVAPEGTIYKVYSHLAALATAAVWINLYDPVWKGFTASSEVTLTKNPWDSVIIAPNGGFSSILVGVPLIDVAASTTAVPQYFWAQTWGPCPLLTQGTVVIGQRVGLGGTVDGAIGPIADGDEQGVGVGRVIRVNASTEYSLIFLTIAP